MAVPPRQRSVRAAAGGGASPIATSVMVLLACLATAYVGGRLWRLQQMLLQQQLVTGQPNAHNKPVSVEESMLKIELGELQKREGLLQLQLAEAKAKGFVSAAAGGSSSFWTRGINSTSVSSAGPSAGSSSSSGSGGGGGGGGARKLLAVVGVNTRFASRPQREVVRSTWMPTGPGLKKLEEDEGVVVRFLVGRSPNRGDSSDRAIAAENSTTHDFLIMDDHEEDDNDMARKLKNFYESAVSQWDADFYVKMEDDVYLNLAQLVTLLKSMRSRPRLYMGCMKSGEIVSDPNARWYEPEWKRFGDGKQYYTHAASPLHVLTKELALYIGFNRPFLHEYKHEDVSLGAWMMGVDANYEDNRLLCCPSAPEDECFKHREAGTPCVAVYDWHCSGLCEAEKRMADVHRHCGLQGANTNADHHGDGKGATVRQ